MAAVVVAAVSFVAACTDDSGSDATGDTASPAEDTAGGNTTLEHPAPFEPCDEISETSVSEVVGTDVTKTGIATGSVVNGIETDGCTWTGADVTVSIQVLAPPDPIAYLDDVIATTYEPVDDADVGDLPDGSRAVRLPGQPLTDSLVAPDGDNLFIVSVVADGEPDLDRANELMLEVIDAH